MNLTDGKEEHTTKSYKEKLSLYCSPSPFLLKTPHQKQDSNHISTRINVSHCISSSSRSRFEAKRRRKSSSSRTSVKNHNNMIKGREAGKGPPSTDLLVCFPSRAHLTLMPKPICSPARPSDSSKRHHQNHHHSHLRKSITRGNSIGQASPLLWPKTKPNTSEISEPTSPKVTCAGQIKVRTKPASCKNWQSVMEEIERIHNKGKHKKRPAWIEAFGFKKDVMQFLTCLRNIRFDFRCFGAFPTADITSDDDEDEEDDEEDDHFEDCGQNSMEKEDETPRTVFSKWFMVLQENQSRNFSTEKLSKEKTKSYDHQESVDDVPCVPPANALLLMRCRSAPAKSWLEEMKEEEEKAKENDHDHDQDDEEEDDHVSRVCSNYGDNIANGSRSYFSEEEHEEKVVQGKMKLGKLMEEERRRENLVLMTYGADLCKISSDIAKETWVVGGIRDVLSRSRSWKR